MEEKNYNGWPVPSQHPNIAPPGVKRNAERNYLPSLIQAWKDVERTTGYRWRATSYWRDSPSHRKGCSLDIAPDIAPEDKYKYAVFRGSDPVLYKRTKLIRSLQQLARTKRYYPYSMGLFVEPDHIHMQVIDPAGSTPTVKVFKWKLAKHAYRDTLERMKLPMM